MGCRRYMHGLGISLQWRPQACGFVCRLAGKGDGIKHFPLGWPGGSDLHPETMQGSIHPQSVGAPTPRADICSWQHHVVDYFCYIPPSQHACVGEFEALGALLATVPARALFTQAYFWVGAPMQQSAASPPVEKDHRPQSTLRGRSLLRSYACLRDVPLP